MEYLQSMKLQRKTRTDFIRKGTGNTTTLLLCAAPFSMKISIQIIRQFVLKQEDNFFVPTHVTMFIKVVDICPLYSFLSIPHPNQGSHLNLLCSPHIHNTHFHYIPSASSFVPTPLSYQKPKYILKRSLYFCTTVTAFVGHTAHYTSDTFIAHLLRILF